MNQSRRTMLASMSTTAAALVCGSPWAVAASNPFTLQSFEQIRKRYAGQPLVVHLWGMTCGPCLVELPKWGELLRRQPNLHLVLIQADQTPARASEQALRGAGLLKAESWSVASEMDEFMRASIDPKWQGEMPMTLLISPGGEITRLSGVADLGQVKRWLGTVSTGAR